MTIAYDENTKRWRHTDGARRGKFATQDEVDGQSETPPGSDRSIGRTSGLTDETIARILDLKRIQVTQIGAVAELAEAQQNFVVPVTVGYAYEERWIIRPQVPRLNKISMSMLYEC